jgi:ABC-type multidrug transport system ATPase subunit
MKIALENASKKFAKVLALRNVTVTFEPGQIVGLVGPNGAGKTTLLRCLAGILVCDHGQIRYDGDQLQRDRLDLRRRFHFLPDFPVFLPAPTMIRHIGMMLRLYQADGDGSEERVLQLLRDFDLLPLAEAAPLALSRGQLYKAALAGLMAVDPEVWLLDEPFASGIDPQGISVFRRQARGIHDATRSRSVPAELACREPRRKCAAAGGTSRCFRRATRPRNSHPQRGLLAKLP